MSLVSAMNETDKVNTEWWSFADHLIKTDVTESLVKISLTNSKHLWTTILLKDDLVKMAKEQNPAMEASDVRFLSAGLELLRGEPNDLQCNVQYEDVTSSVTCSLRSSLEGFSFSLNVNLVQANLQQYYEQITLPLLLTIQQLQTQREELMKIINTKDEEIGEYRLTGATLFRKSVATKFFNKEEFLQGSCGKTKIPSSSLFQPDTVFRDTLSLFNQIKAKYEEPEDKKKEIKVKTEPGTPPSQSSTSQQPTKQKSRSESPVLLLSKRPQRGKLASLI